LQPLALVQICIIAGDSSAGSGIIMSAARGKIIRFTHMRDNAHRNVRVKDVTTDGVHSAARQAFTNNDTDVYLTYYDGSAQCLLHDNSDLQIALELAADAPLSVQIWANEAAYTAAQTGTS
jgi:hypothetical protein